MGAGHQLPYQDSLAEDVLLLAVEDIQPSSQGVVQFYTTIIMLEPHPGQTNTPVDARSAEKVNGCSFPSL